ncbi:MAG: SDR family NAD(P)-dependent oxidoreductase [Cyclobacteriaceae bacterium]
MTKIAFITGATSGIGLATARELAGQQYNLIICGRRTERLQALKEELTGKAEVYPLSFDVRDRKAVEEAIGSLPETWKAIDVLVNNAGNAHGLDPIQSGDPDDWDAMIDINVKGLLYVSRAIMPGMVDRKKGHIVNISSIAGKEVYPNGNVYSATKHAVDALNKGMRMDLNAHGIKVTAINPGLVETEFSEVRFKGDNDRATKVYQGYKALQAEDIAEVITFTVSRPPHVVLSDVMVLPLAQASSTLVNKDQ